LFVFAVFFSLLYTVVARQLLNELEYESFITSPAFLSYINFSSFFIKSKFIII
jgi:hypothetical protein